MKPAPTTLQSGQTTSFTTVPVIRAVNDAGVVDTGYAANIVVAVTDPNDGTVDGTVNSLMCIGDTDGTTVTKAATNGEATFAGLALQYTVGGTAQNTIALKATSGDLSSVNSDSLTVTGAPTVTGVSAITAPGSYRTNAVVTLAVTFDQAVTVSGGTPTLELETGVTDQKAVYTGASGDGKVLYFQYTVQDGDVSPDLDYSGTAALALNGASNHSGLSFSFAGAEAGATYTYSIADTDVATAAVTGNGTIATAADQIKNINVSVLSDGDLTLTVYLTDAAGNRGVSASGTVGKDTGAPTVGSVNVPANWTYRAGQTPVFTVNYSEKVFVSDAPYLPVTIGSNTVPAEYQGGSGSTALTFRYSITAGAQDSDGISCGTSIVNGGSICDAAGNVAAADLHNTAGTGAIRVDTAVPTLATVAIASNNANPALAKTGDTLILQFIASESISTPTMTIAGHLVAVNTGGVAAATNWQALYTLQSGDIEGNIPFTISYADLAGNPGTVVSTTTNGSSVNFDKTSPTAKVTYSKNPVKAGDSLTITATFNESLANNPAVQIAISGAENSATEKMTRVSATQYTYTYTVGNGIGNATVSFCAGTDLAGNLVTATPVSGATYKELINGFFPKEEQKRHMTIIYYLKNFFSRFPVTRDSALPPRRADGP
jgi:hypothetical protein